MNSKPYNQKTLQRTVTELQRQNNILQHRITQLEAEQQTASLNRKEVSKNIEQMENSRKLIEQDYEHYKSTMEATLEKMEDMVEDKDRLLGTLKTQKFSLEETNQMLEQGIREAQLTINTLTRELNNRNNFIRESLQRKNSLQTNQ